MDTLIRRLDLTSLRLFVQTCEARSITRAAAQACIVASAVSRRISDLESSVGVPLLYRSPRGITPTAAGATMLEYARRALAELDQMSAALGRHTSGLTGRIRVAANLSSVDQYLPEDIAAFARAHPEVSVDLEEMRGADVRKCVENGSADLGIGNDWYLADAGLASRPYRQDRLVAIFPRGHAKASLPGIRYADMLDEPLLGLHAESAYNAKLMEEAARQGRQVEFRIRVTSFDAMCRMVHAGLGSAVMLRQLADMHAGILDIAVVPLTDEWSLKSILVAYRSEDTLPAPARTLLDFLTGGPGKGEAADR